MNFPTSGAAQTAAIDKSPLPPINPEAEVPANEDLGFSRPKTSNVTRSPRKLPKLPDDAAPLPPPLEEGAQEEDGEADADAASAPVTTERGTDTRDVAAVEGDSKEEDTGGDGDKLKLEENEENEEQQTGKEPDGSAAAGSAGASKAASKVSVRSPSVKDTSATSAEAGAAEVGSPKEDAKGSQSSVRSISIYARASATAWLHKLSEIHTGLGERVGPRLCESCLLAPSVHGASSRNLGTTL